MVLTRTTSHSRQETLSSLSNPRRAPTQVVQTFQGFSARRASASMGAITELEHDSVAPSIAPSREHPSTPTRQKKDGPPGRPGGGPPEDGDHGGGEDDPFADATTTTTALFTQTKKNLLRLFSDDSPMPSVP